ncbi:MAG TPA: class IV adenylate cyclase, partial [Candidatus Polarisedimenticolia bacterium]|nr:class IV adenylate cyclase [Candidatus Polarisedimenticolia bacterium]
MRGEPARTDPDHGAGQPPADLLEQVLVHQPASGRSPIPTASPSNPIAVYFRPVAPHVELEIKLKVEGPGESSDRLERLNARLREMGATVIIPREFEDNLAFDFPDRSIVRSGSLLRVRIMARGSLLTFKGPVMPLPGLAAGARASDPSAQPASATPRSATPSTAAGPPMKARQETEIDIPSKETDALLAIIRGLGMQPVFQYQKYRTTWEWRGLHILLDETPIGIYLELEGEQALIEAGAQALGYRAEDFITKSYRDLYLEHLDQGQKGSQGSRSTDR